MSYRIEITKSAAKQLKNIPNPDRKRIADKIDSLAEDLPNPDTTKLKGNNPFHRIRAGSYRIIYEIRDDVLVILVLKIGHRRDVYKHLS